MYKGATGSILESLNICLQDAYMLSIC